MDDLKSPSYSEPNTSSVFIPPSLTPSTNQVATPTGRDSPHRRKRKKSTAKEALSSEAHSPGVIPSWTSTTEYPPSSSTLKVPSKNSHHLPKDGVNNPRGDDTSNFGHAIGGIPLLQIDLQDPHKPQSSKLSLEQVYPNVMENLKKFDLSVFPGRNIHLSSDPNNEKPFEAPPPGSIQQSPYHFQPQEGSIPVAMPLLSLPSTPTHPFPPQLLHPSNLPPSLPSLPTSYRLHHSPSHPPNSSPSPHHPPPPTFVLPYVPIRPFASLLIQPPNQQIHPLSFQEHKVQQAAPNLLHLDDPLTQMKQGGFKLLSVGELGSDVETKEPLKRTDLKSSAKLSSAKFSCSTKPDSPELQSTVEEQTIDKRQAETTSPLNEGNESKDPSFSPSRKNYQRKDRKRKPHKSAATESVDGVQSVNLGRDFKKAESVKVAPTFRGGGGEVESGKLKSDRAERRSVRKAKAKKMDSKPAEKRGAALKKIDPKPDRKESGTQTAPVKVVSESESAGKIESVKVGAGRKGTVVEHKQGELVDRKPAEREIVQPVKAYPELASIKDVDRRLESVMKDINSIRKKNAYGMELAKEVSSTSKTGSKSMDLGMEITSLRPKIGTHLHTAQDSDKVEKLLPHEETGLAPVKKLDKQRNYDQVEKNVNQSLSTGSENESNKKKPFVLIASPRRNVSLPNELPPLESLEIRRLKFYTGSETVSGTEGKERVTEDRCLSRSPSPKSAMPSPEMVTPTHSGIVSNSKTSLTPTPPNSPPPQRSLRRPLSPPPLPPPPQQPLSPPPLSPPKKALSPPPLPPLQDPPPGKLPSLLPLKKTLPTSAQAINKGSKVDHQSDTIPYKVEHDAEKTVRSSPSKYEETELLQRMDRCSPSFSGSSHSEVESTPDEKLGAEERPGRTSFPFDTASPKDLTSVKSLMAEVKQDSTKRGTIRHLQQLEEQLSAIESTARLVQGEFEDTNKVAILFPKYYLMSWVLRYLNSLLYRKVKVIELFNGHFIKESSRYYCPKSIS